MKDRLPPSVDLGRLAPRASERSLLNSLRRSLARATAVSIGAAVLTVGVANAEVNNVDGAANPGRLSGDATSSVPQRDLPFTVDGRRAIEQPGDPQPSQRPDVEGVNFNTVEVNPGTPPTRTVGKEYGEATPTHLQSESPNPWSPGDVVWGGDYTQSSEKQ